MRFASHRDIARAVERGVRMAGLPVAYSAGFSPHPKISYIGGAPTGAASEAEYLEIALTGSREPADVLSRLGKALPDGIDVIEVVDTASAPEALRLEASAWEVVLPGVTPDEAERAAAVFMAAAEAEVERLTSKGIRRFDSRAAVVTLEVVRRAAEAQVAGCAILRMVVRHLTPAVRPDDILAALRQMSALAPSSPPLATRLAQGPIGLVRAAAGAGMPGCGPAEQAGPAGLLSSPASVPQPHGRGTAQGQEKATRLDAEIALPANAAPVSAYEQLPRGAERPAMVGCAREPDGRDCPDARDRATQQRVR
jgi:radical SAM-linked protein